MLGQRVEDDYCGSSCWDRSHRPDSRGRVVDSLGRPSGNQRVGWNVMHLHVCRISGTQIHHSHPPRNWAVYRGNAYDVIQATKDVEIGASGGPVWEERVQDELIVF